MGTPEATIVIKKYRNRRLYHVGTGSYLTLKDLTGIAKTSDNFVVYDVKTGLDITRSMLGHIIQIEEENEQNNNLLPITFMRKLMRFYGDGMQVMVSCYLELSINALVREQQRLHEPMAVAVSGFGVIDDQLKRHIEMLERAFEVFVPLARHEDHATDPNTPETVRRREAVTSM